MRNYLEICERSHTGKPIAKDDWDYLVMQTVMDMAEKYDLAADRTEIFPSDETIPDRLFLAGKELIETIGVYSISTGRQILLGREEIEEGLANTPQTLVMGEGKDARTLFARKPVDERPPLVFGGNPGVPTPEALFLPTIKSWMKEPVVDFVTCGSIVDVDGFAVRSGEPSELAAVKRELQYLRQGMKQVGRPGMGMLGAESSVTVIGDLAAAHPDYLRPCDAHLVALMNELMIDTDNMLRAASSIEYGMRNASLACTMIGGLGGGAPGSTMLMIASMMAANIVCLADYHLCHPIHLKFTATSTRECMWLQSALCQAFARNAPSIIVCDIYPKSGALTKELLYEVAANALVITAGGGHLEGVGSADGNVPNGTGLEVRLMGEVGRAAARQRLGIREAGELVSRLLAKYEHVFALENGNPGKRFDEAYDMVTVEPVPEWMAMYREAAGELRGMGLEI